jgi:3-methyladenine DNA glycosylase/8-oxoguanine DNA glycosylase
MADELSVNDEVSPRAVASLYGREPLDRAAFEQLAERWRPYRMWAVVLLRFSSNREPTAWQRGAMPAATAAAQSRRQQDPSDSHEHRRPS